jgi:hypothetical protein
MMDAVGFRPLEKMANQRGVMQLMKTRQRMSTSWVARCQAYAGSTARRIAFREAT